MCFGQSGAEHHLKKWTQKERQLLELIIAICARYADDGLHWIYLRWHSKETNCSEPTGKEKVTFKMCAPAGETK
jgi:hypothetical protein